MNKQIFALWCWGLWGLLGCASGAKVSATPAATAASAPRIHAAQAVVSQAPAESRAAADSDRAFIANAERAIGEYSEFLARAGDSAEFAPAVERSREQIEDLRAAIVFVRDGAQERAFRQQ